MNKAFVARALADAMLCGPAELVGARVRCAQVLGNDPLWLGRLVRAMLAAHGAQWNANSRRALVQSIVDNASLRGAMGRDNPITVRRWFFLPPAMGPLPNALDSCAIPDLADDLALSRFLAVHGHDLQWLSGRKYPRNYEHYAHRWLAKRRGGWRLLEMPKARLRAVQRHLLHELLDFVPAHEAAHGFRRGHSIVSHAQMHVGQRVVLRMDLQDFFLNIRAARVKGIFSSLGYPTDIAITLTGLCTHQVPLAVLHGSDAIGDSAQHPSSTPNLDWQMRKRYQDPHLPQGAPTSPALANLCAFNLDLRLDGLAARFAANYSRYADDLTFSGDAQLLRSIDRLVAIVGSIVSEEGFALNFRKTRVMSAAQRQQVTGVMVNQALNLRRSDFDVLKATLYNCVRNGPRAENRSDHAQFRAHLTGRVAHAVMLNPTRAAKLRELLKRIDWGS